jgi:hypothetical protein
MKKIVLSFLSLMLIYSCSKSDSATSSSSLVGMWKYTQYGADTNKNNKMDANEYFNVPDSETRLLTLNSDGKGFNDQGAHFTWLINGTNYISTDSTGKKDTAQYALSGSKLTFIFPKTPSGDFMTWLVCTKQ